MSCQRKTEVRGYIDNGFALKSSRVLTMNLELSTSRRGNQHTTFSKLLASKSGNRHRRFKSFTKVPKRAQYVSPRTKKKSMLIIGVGVNSFCGAKFFLKILN